jgi:hypothetical protein
VAPGQLHELRTFDLERSGAKSLGIAEYCPRRTSERRGGKHRQREHGDQ